jgi:hypothetical protein
MPVKDAGEINGARAARGWWSLLQPGGGTGLALEGLALIFSQRKKAPPLRKMRATTGHPELTDLANFYGAGTATRLPGTICC